MSTETSLAFAHPEERAAATSGGGMPDRISLRDHVVPVEIGAFQTERDQVQRLCFNIVVELRPHPAPLEDDVDRILSYDVLTEAVAAELAAERLNLLETLAERVADRILRAPQALRVFVRIEKLDRGPGALGVEIVRTHKDNPALDATPMARPLVVWLGGDPAPPLEALKTRGLPVILVVGLPEGSVPQAATPAAQRRIDLLAIEQNAWDFASRHPDCLVVGTRTEIDWAIRERRVIVWAPSKLVLDAVEGPEDARDALGLAAWLAELLGAEALVLAGPGELPAETAVPVERLVR